MTTITIDGLTVRKQANTVLHDVGLRVESGRVLAPHAPQPAFDRIRGRRWCKSGGLNGGRSGLAGEDVLVRRVGLPGPKLWRGAGAQSHCLAADQRASQGEERRHVAEGGEESPAAVFGETPEKPRGYENQAETPPCWGHGGTFFALGHLFFVLGHLLGTSRLPWVLLASI